MQNTIPMLAQEESQRSKNPMLRASAMRGRSMGQPKGLSAMRNLPMLAARDESVGNPVPADTRLAQLRVMPDCLSSNFQLLATSCVAKAPCKRRIAAMLRHFHVHRGW